VLGALKMHRERGTVFTELKPSSAILCSRQCLTLNVAFRGTEHSGRRPNEWATRMV
jgi:hypothetical protein